MRQWFILPLLVLLAWPAQAQPIKPPPDPQHFSSRSIHQNLQRWYENLTTDCILAVRDDAQINRIAGQISKHQAQPDQGIYVNYFNKVLLPLYNAQLAGVPGYGTYAEIDAKRQEFMKFLNDQLPKGPAGTEAEIKTFIAAYQAYAKRAAEMRTWLMGLHKLSPCHREQRFENITLLKGFHNLNRFTDPAMVKARLAEIRDPLVPHFGGMGEIEGFFQKLESPGVTVDLLYWCEMILDAVRTYVKLVDVEKQYAVLPLWASIFEGEEKTQLLGKQAAVVATREKILKSVGTIFANIEPPAARPDKGLESTAKGLVKGRAAKILTVRVTSPKGTYKGSIEKFVKKISETKVLMRKYEIKYDHFGVAYVSDERPYAWWPDLPGLPASDVCSLMIGVAKKYSKGVDVTTGKWLFESNDTRHPILCKNATAAGKPL
jgi:hypothetical protein